MLFYIKESVWLMDQHIRPMNSLDTRPTQAIIPNKGDRRVEFAPVTRSLLPRVSN